jgi:hypothetical protein
MTAQEKSAADSNHAVAEQFALRVQSGVLRLLAEQFRTGKLRRNTLDRMSLSGACGDINVAARTLDEVAAQLDRINVVGGEN